MGGGSVTERGWAAVDARARTAKRAAFAETKRGFKLVRERLRNAAIAAVNLSAKQLRRVSWFGARVQKQGHELGETTKRVDTYPAEGAVEREIVGEVGRRIGASRTNVLHPSLMYRLFHQFWLGHRPPSFLEKRTRYQLISPPDVALPPLPAQYVAVKFYSAASLPPTDPVRRALQSIVLGLAEQAPVVMLDTGLALDDHEDYSFAVASRIHSVRESLQPRDNLAVQ